MSVGTDTRKVKGEYLNSPKKHPLPITESVTAPDGRRLKEPKRDLWNSAAISASVPGSDNPGSTSPNPPKSPGQVFTSKVGVLTRLPKVPSLSRTLKPSSHAKRRLPGGETFSVTYM